ncbi:MAG TPA: phage portal protein [Cyclobacteriaceae bacterium]|nr:phage portal protein [Cyclobacteriaceae bacterium]
MGNILSNWTVRLITNWFRGIRQVGGVWFYPINGDAYTYRGLDYLKAFEEIPELNAIINMKANCFSNGKVRAFKASASGLTEVTETDPVVNLLKRPTFFQAEKEFMKQTKCFHEIFGNEYLYINAGTGTKKLGNFIKGVKAITSLPPNLMDCEYTQTVPFFEEDRNQQPDGIKYIYDLGNNQTQTLDNDFIIHLNDNRVSIKDPLKKDFLKGESKMKALTAPINNIRMAYETRGVILANRGALGILSNEGSDVAGQIPMTGEEREELYKQYENNYGGLQGQKSLIIANGKVRYQQISVAPDKLGLFQETREDFFKMCDSYGTPQELFANEKGTTFDNQNEAYKRMYDSTILPEANEWIGALQSFFYPNGEVILTLDYSHLAVYQEDVELNASALAALVNALSKALADGAIDIPEYQNELNKLGLAVGNK